MTAAIILAGGRASRLDGAAKPLLEIDGRTLLDRAVAAVADCDPIIAVGPEAPVPRGHQVLWTRETPLFGGPVAALAAGLALLENIDRGESSANTAEVYVLAADLPSAEAAVDVLRRHPPLAGDARTGDEDGVCLSDVSGRPQWLIGRYRTRALRAAVAALPDAGRDASVRSLLKGLAVTALPAGALATDVDTWDDLERARAASPGPRTPAIEEQS